MSGAAMPPAPHLSAEQVERYLRRALPAAELLAVDDHIAECAACRTRLAAGAPLDAAWEAWAALPERPRRSGLPRLATIGWVGGVSGIAAVLAALLAGGVLLRQFRPAPPPPPAARSIAVALLDGGERVALDRAGRLSGLPSLPPAWRERVAVALRTRRLAGPAALALLALPPSALRGMEGMEEESALAPESPVGTLTRNARPAFRWRPLPGDWSYEVAVFDARLSRVAASGPLSGTGWTPPRDLPAGGVLTWQVTARGNGEEVTAPRPPRPEARFLILSPEEAAALARDETAAGHSHLARAVLYAGAGLVEEARAELRALAAENGGAAGGEVISALLRSLPQRR
jgi:putative zinc finger protein